MLSKSERLLIFRFLFSKKSDGYVSIFSLFSIVGISLGVAAIIIVMSVMNGFRIDLTSRIIGLNSHLNIYSFEKEIENDQIKSKLDESEINSVNDILSETELWLENDELTKEDYDNKITEINSKLNPIMMKVYSEGGNGEMPEMVPENIPMNQVSPDQNPTIDEID